MPKQETAAKSPEKSNYDADELKQLYDIDKNSFRTWINVGPLTHYGLGLSSGRDSKLTALAPYVRVALSRIEHVQLSASEPLKKKLVHLLVNLLPGISAISFELSGENITHKSIETTAQGEQAIYTDDETIPWFTRIAQYDRLIETVSENGRDAIGNNKLARLSILAGPSFLTLLKDMNTKQQAEILLLIKAGKIPPQLISDEELGRIEAYNQWIQAKKKDSNAPEPTLPARSHWINLIRQQLERKIDYDIIKREIKNQFPDETVASDGTVLYNMIDLTEEDNSLDEVPDMLWFPNDSGGFN